MNVFEVQNCNHFDSSCLNHLACSRQLVSFKQNYCIIYTHCDNQPHIAWARCHLGPHYVLTESTISPVCGLVMVPGLLLIKSGSGHANEAMEVQRVNGIDLFMGCCCSARFVAGACFSVHHVYVCVGGREVGEGKTRTRARNIHRYNSS